MNRVPLSESKCGPCTTGGERGSCARLRCYCGHSECWAFDSYYDARATTVTTTRKPDERMARSWAERDEPTWLDR